MPEGMMRASWIVCAALACAPVSAAQSAAPAVPDHQPYFIPYGEPISLDLAKRAVEAAQAEAARRGWKLAIAVTSPSGDLTYFLKMDDTQLVSAEIAPRKARTAVRFRRNTQIFFEQMETGHPYVITLDPDIVTAPGGIPIVIGGKLVGGIGCSGATGAQDAAACQAGVDAITR
jgi:uncharacterized protein GlcG (DUF336 family)